MKRGDIWRARLAGPIGSGPGHKRPVVVQRNPFNDSRIATVVVAMITSNLALAEAPGNVRIAKSGSDLFTATRRQCLASTLDGSVLVSGVNHSLAPSWTRPPQV
jgi:mRNA interferase MazF